MAEDSARRKKPILLRHLRPRPLPWAQRAAHLALRLQLHQHAHDLGLVVGKFQRGFDVAQKQRPRSHGQYVAPSRVKACLRCSCNSLLLPQPVLAEVQGATSNRVSRLRAGRPRRLATRSAPDTARPRTGHLARAVRGPAGY